MNLNIKSLKFIYLYFFVSTEVNTYNFYMWILLVLVQNLQPGDNRFKSYLFVGDIYTFLCF